MPRPAARRPCPGCWPNASSGSRCWSPSTAYNCARTISRPAGAAPPAPVRALLAAFHGRLAAEVYRQAAVITPGNTHARRWQERCGADRARLRTVYPGMDAARFAAVGEGDAAADTVTPTLVWVGRIEPAKDLFALLHAFAEVRKEEPDARLRILGSVRRYPYRGRRPFFFFFF